MYKPLLCQRFLRSRYIALASIISVTLCVMTIIGATTRLALNQSPSVSGEQSADTSAQLFEDRPDLILPDLNHQTAGNGGKQPFKVHFIDIDEEFFPISSRSQATVFALKVPSPELLLNESHIVQLRNSKSPSKEDSPRTFAALENRIRYQEEFPVNRVSPSLISFTIGLYR